MRSFVTRDLHLPRDIYVEIGNSSAIRTKKDLVFAFRLGVSWPLDKSRLLCNLYSNLQPVMELKLKTILLDKYFDSERASIVEEETVVLVSPETGQYIVCYRTTAVTQILLVSGLIHDIYPAQGSVVPDIDLRGLTVLPGLVDTHVHCKPKNSD